MDLCIAHLPLLCFIVSQTDVCLHRTWRRGDFQAASENGWWGTCGWAGVPSLHPLISVNAYWHGPRPFNPSAKPDNPQEDNLLLLRNHKVLLNLGTEGGCPQGWQLHCAATDQLAWSGKEPIWPQACPEKGYTPHQGLAGFQTVFEKCLEYLKPPVWDLG